MVQMKNEELTDASTINHNQAALFLADTMVKFWQIR